MRLVLNVSSGKMMMYETVPLCNSAVLSLLTLCLVLSSIALPSVTYGVMVYIRRFLILSNNN